MVGASAMKRSAKARQESSGDLHSAENAVALERSDKKRSATAGDEASGDEHPAERNVFMVLNGRVPENLKKSLVAQKDSYHVNEVKEIVDTLSGFPVLCGFDCASDVEQLAEMHSCLKSYSVEHGELSWHILYDERAWEMTRPLQVIEIIPASMSCVERCCGMCEMKK